MRALAHVVAFATIAFCAAAHAHQVGLSRGVYVVDDARIEAEVQFARGEVIGLVQGLDANGDAALDEGEVQRAGPAIGAAIVPGFVVDAGGPCAGAFEGASLTEADGLAIRAVYTCAAPIRAATVRVALLSSVAPGHRHLAHVVAGGAESDLVAFSAHPTLTITAGAHETPTASAYLSIGVEHILLGIDHLLFLFGLILIGGRLRSLIGVVTAFTVAHSITLALAALQIVTPSPGIIEPAIALSIAYVGVENFFVKDASKRWRITFPFGLIHGFGFAGALSEVGVPKDDVPLALFLFNAGVEVGQLAVLLVVVPVLLLLRKRGILDTRATQVLSLAVVGMGLFWFVERAFFS